MILYCTKCPSVMEAEEGATCSCGRKMSTVPPPSEPPGRFVIVGPGGMFYQAGGVATSDPTAALVFEHRATAREVLRGWRHWRPKGEWSVVPVMTDEEVLAYEEGGEG